MTVRHNGMAYWMPCVLDASGMGSGPAVACFAKLVGILHGRGIVRAGEVGASGSRQTSLPAGPLRTVRTRRRVHGSSQPRAQPPARRLMSRIPDGFGFPAVDLLV